MNWLVMLLMSLFVPVVQPMIQQGAQNIQARMQQAQQPAPQVVFHEGRWWKYEGGQWYVWTPAQERLAWGPQPWPSNVR